MKKRLYSIFIFLTIFLLLPFFVSAGLNNAFTMAGEAANTAGYVTVGQMQFTDIIGRVIFFILSLLGIIFLLLIIYSGFIWMTAGGNEQKVTKATEMIKQSIIGLLIVIGAYGISYFLVSIFNGQIK